MLAKVLHAYLPYAKFSNIIFVVILGNQFSNLRNCILYRVAKSITLEFLDNRTVHVEGVCVRVLYDLHSFFQRFEDMWVKILADQNFRSGD